LLWSIKIGAKDLSSAVIGPDGTIYVDADDGKLHAINPDSTQKWEIKLGAYSTPAIGTDGTIYAIDPSGKKKWEFGTRNTVSSSAELHHSTPVIGGDGTIYFGGTDDNKIFAVKPDGTKKWQIPTSGYYEAITVGADGTIYAVVGPRGANGGNNYLYAISPNGEEKWTFNTRETALTTPSVGADGTIYVGSSNHKLFALQPNGVQKWQVNNIAYSSPTVGADGTIYVGNKGGLFALGPDGAIKWIFNTDSFYTVIDPKHIIDGNIVKKVNIDSFVKSTPLIGTDGTIYFIADYKPPIDPITLYAIGPDANIRWQYYKFGLESSIYRTPAIGANGTLYIGASYGELYAIESVGFIGAGSVILNKNVMKMQAGESELLTASVLPVDATNKKVRWSSNDNKVAEVDRTGIVSGIAPGTATITVSTENGGFIATCEVTVTPSASPPPVTFTDISGHWAKTNIVNAVKLKIASGYPDGTFRPDENITRAEFALLLMNGIKPAGEGAELAFIDKGQIGEWAVKAVAQACS
jgi:eukaryotic-like serine/threonine-protein kinase